MCFGKKSAAPKNTTDSQGREYGPGGGRVTPKSEMRDPLSERTGSKPRAGYQRKGGKGVVGEQRKGSQSRGSLLNGGR